MKRRHKITNIERITSQDESAMADKFQEELMSQVEEIQGRIFKPDAILEPELEYVSDGVDEAGNEYKLYLGRISRSPVIKNPRTGECFILPWSEIIKMAEAAGLNR